MRAKIGDRLRELDERLAAFEEASDTLRARESASEELVKKQARLTTQLELRRENVETIEETISRAQEASRRAYETLRADFTEANIPLEPDEEGAIDVSAALRRASALQAEFEQAQTRWERASKGLDEAKAQLDKAVTSLEERKESAARTRAELQTREATLSGLLEEQRGVLDGEDPEIVEARARAHLEMMRGLKETASQGEREAQQKSATIEAKIEQLTHQIQRADEEVDISKEKLDTRLETLSIERDRGAAGCAVGARRARAFGG